MRRGRLAGDERGVSSLELAFIAPSLLLLIFFVIQAALYLYGRSVALQAAREGVSQLRLAQNVDSYNQIVGGVRGNVTAFATHVGNGALNDPAAVPSYDDAAGRVQVTVTGRAISLVPLWTFHITERASGQVERFQVVG